MKFLVLAALAVTSAAAWSQEACPPTELEKLIKIGSVPELPKCQDESGFNFIPPSGAPDEVQIALMCATPECQVTIAALIALDPTDCQFGFSSGATLNVKQLVTELPARCAELGM